MEIEVFPNPTDDIINLSVSVSEPGEMNIRLFTAAGAQADEVKGIQIQPGMNLYTIRNDFSPGVYLLVIELNGEQITKRIIVN
ncbi:MAG: T9SS type A sorting domain-containing protein [Bacteroidetes bacterium]|nr:MAG: T9SS type A sorting domain-containing protein [Bacteroidota bacterium]